MNTDPSFIPSSSSPLIWRNRTPLGFFRKHAPGILKLALYLGLTYLALFPGATKCQGQCAPGDFWGDEISGCVGEYEQYTWTLFHCGTDCAYDHWVGYCENDGTLHRWMQHDPCGGSPPPHTLSVGGALSCGAINGSWCTGWASLLITATDSYGGHVVTISPCGSNPCSVSLPEGEGNYGYGATCVDTGLSTTGSTYYALDLTPPVVSSWLTGGVPGAGSWYTSGPVTLNCSETDVPSGVPAGGGITYGTRTANGDGTWPLSCTGTDIAGLTASSGATVNIDGTPPVITPTVSGGTLGAGGWYLSGPVDLTCGANDATSGVASVVYGTMTATAPGTTVLDCTVYDNAGNSSYYSIPIQIDNVPPSAKFEYSGDYCTGGWYNSYVYASILMEDLLSGGGHTEFSVDGEAWDSSKPIKDGIHSLTGKVWDITGNFAELSETLQVDTHPPITSFITESDKWFAGSVSLSGQSVDWTSGISLVEISLDGGQTWIPIGKSANWSYDWKTLDPDNPDESVPDGSYTILARAKDHACNQEHTASIVVNVDNTPPDLTLKDTINLMGRTTTVIAVDLGSGVDHGFVTITGNGIDPVKIDFSTSTEVSWDGRGGNGSEAPFGLYDIAVDVWDRVGNHSSATGTWLRPAPATPTSIPPVAVIVVPEQPKPEEPKVKPALTLAVREDFWRIAVWPAVALTFLFIGVGAAKFVDRRPDELRRLGDILARRSVQGRR